MQRSSPFGYRRRACSPRKRGLIGVFSSGNCTVILRLKRWRPVSAMPFASSTSRKVLKNSRILSITKSPYVPGRLHPDGDHDQPYDRERYEYLPSEPHDLVVAVARERRPEPQEQRHHEEDLGEQPRERRGFVEERPIHRRPPAPQKKYPGQGRH